MTTHDLKKLAARNDDREHWKPYPAYKDSGVEWLGEVPAHWEVCQLRRKLKNGVDGIKIGPFGSSLKREYMVGDGYKVYGQENVIYNDFKAGRNYVDGDKYLELEQYSVFPGDLLITMMGSSGRCRLVPPEIEVGIMDSHLLRLRVREQEIAAPFAQILLDQARYIDEQLKALGKGAIMHGLNSSIVKSVVLALPPLTEQRTIAAFLDRETAKIDTLITKKQRLIELLQEKRAALISHAVTKGLDPSVPMRDSGVPWLGDIPAHWEVKRVKHITKIFRGKFTHRPRNDPELYDGPYPFIQTGDVANAGKYITEYHQTLNEKGLAVSQLFPAGTLVMTIAANIGDLAVLSFSACFPDSVVGFAPAQSTDLNFLYHSLSSLKIDMEVTAVQNTQLNLNVERIGNRQMAYPPLDEQIEIANYLDSQNETNERLVAKIQQAVLILEEYRDALILAAVTGKIDVRGKV